MLYSQLTIYPSMSKLSEQLALPLLPRDAAHVFGKPDFHGPYQGGTGRSLPKGILIACSISAFFASTAATWLVWKQLKNYRKPNLQRYVVRLLIM